MLQKEDVLTVEEASELLRVSVNSIRASLAKGQLPGAKVGREWRLSRLALADYLSQYAARNNDDDDDDEGGKEEAGQE
ncbi:MAG: helix-turn-helix domain-containing protein [Ardenticatenaceae bacterium]